MAFVNKQLGQDLTPIFDQYLRRAALPVLELTFDENEQDGVVSLERRRARLRDADSRRRSGEVADDSARRPTGNRCRGPRDKDAFKVATDLYYVNVACPRCRRTAAKPEEGHWIVDRGETAFRWIARSRYAPSTVAAAHRVACRRSITPAVSLIIPQRHSSRSARSLQCPAAHAHVVVSRLARSLAAAVSLSRPPRRVCMRRKLAAFILAARVRRAVIGANTVSGPHRRHRCSMRRAAPCRACSSRSPDRRPMSQTTDDIG